MKIYETSVRKPISTILIFTAVIIFGLFSVRNLAIDQFPEMEIPAMSVITTYSGANTSDVETNVTRVLEDQLNSVDHLKEITSTSSDGMSMISLEFEWGTDIDAATNDVRDIIGRISEFLPDGVSDPIIFKFSSSMMPVMMLYATADESYNALGKILDDQLVNELNRIDGVGSVSVMGAPKREIQVNVDPRKLEAYGLTVEAIGGIIAQENVNSSAGSIEMGNNNYTIKADGEFDTSDELNSIVLASVAGKDIMLKDVANIVDTLEKSNLDERINGEKAVRIIIQKQSGANTVQIVNKIKEKLPEIQASLPNDITIGILNDSADSITDSINSLAETVLFALVFVVLVVLFFLGRWRATLIIALTIPVSLIVSFIYLYVTGGTLNIISLSSLSIAIGMVVDDAIVVLENITKHIERGSTPKEAAIYGTNEVWLSVIATTLTVIAVFMPLTMVGGIAGVMFKQFGWIVSLVVTVSTIAAISLTPMLSSLLLKNTYHHTYKGIGKIFKPIDKFLDWLDEAYAKLLNKSLAHRLTMFFGPLAIFAAVLVLLGRNIESEFMPASDGGRMSATIELEQTLGLEYTEAVARKIDSIIYKNYPEVEILSTSASAGAASSNASTFQMMNSSSSATISYTMRLPDASERERTVFQMMDALRKDLAEIPEIRTSLVSMGGMMGGGMMGGTSTVELKVYGYDIDETTRIAEELREMSSKLEGARDVQVSRDAMRPEYNIRFDRNKLAYYGLNSATVSSQIRNRMSGMTASLFREDGDEYYIVVRHAEEFRTSFQDVENIIVYTSQGKPVRVGELATIEETFSPPTIERENRQRVVTVTLQLGDGVALSEVVDEVNGMLAGYTVPAGISIDVGGSLEDQQESFGDLAILALLIILLVFIVMATQFESFVMPFIIIFTIIFAVPGVILALWMTNTTLSMTALIGAIMLIGIVVKNGIVMVDYTNLMRERGYSLADSVVLAGKSRLRPVLMTSLTTILGMLPMALGIGEGSEMWQPMGIAVIGGLTFSTILTILATPAIYSLFIGAGEKRRARKQARKEAKMINA